MEYFDAQHTLTNTSINLAIKNHGYIQTSEIILHLANSQNQQRSIPFS